MGNDENDDAGIADAVLDEWERMASGATEGPWRASNDKNGGSRDVYAGPSDDPTTVAGSVLSCDGTFIAAAREAVPQLVRAYRSERGWAREVHVAMDEVVALRDRVKALEKVWNELAERVKDIGDATMSPLDEARADAARRNSAYIRASGNAEAFRDLALALIQLARAGQLSAKQLEQFRAQASKLGICW